MEVWIEPKLGKCVCDRAVKSNEKDFMQFANGLDFIEIAQQFLCREHQQVLFESSFNRLKQDCQDGNSWEEDSESTPEPIKNRPSNPSESFDRPYAIYNNRFNENRLDEVFKNRMNRLGYVPTTFDLALLLQHGVKARFKLHILITSQYEAYTNYFKFIFETFDSNFFISHYLNQVLYVQTSPMMLTLT